MQVVQKNASKISTQMEEFNAYWDLPSMTKKCSYLAFRLTQNKVQRKQEKETWQWKRKGIRYEFWFPVSSGGLKDDGYNICVFQKMFFDSQGIFTTAVRTAFEKDDKQTGTQELTKEVATIIKKELIKYKNRSWLSIFFHLKWLNPIT